MLWSSVITHTDRDGCIGLSARGKQQSMNGGFMKKENENELEDELFSEYDFSKMTGY
ncbi:hypothetical protein NIES4071_13130 [Calothrix sp. NIES-4071]|nr:hypothetical protein NIES4071_13130 [Calothrix sp. NIES-4071]BAZ55653.1 hypothetical protein NIES4105_13090 [Calothrix sp. NIES-4105]